MPPGQGSCKTRSRKWHKLVCASTKEMAAAGAVGQDESGETSTFFLGVFFYCS